MKITDVEAIILRLPEVNIEATNGSQDALIVPVHMDVGRLDGASEFGLYWRVVVPVIRPALSALALFVFTTSWNDFLLPLVYLRSQEIFTVQLTIDSIFRVKFAQNFHLLMSASVLAVVPMTILFFTLQRQFIAGLTLGSVKE